MIQTNLEIKRGDTKTYTLTFTNNDNILINLTGYTVFFTVKENINDVDSLAKISKTITTHSAPTIGVTELVLSATENNLVGHYLYDIQVKDPLGEIETVQEGIITFTKDITIRIV